MNIDFKKNVNGFQDARKLRMILEHYSYTDIADKSTHLFIQSLLQELDEFLASAEFEKFHRPTELDTSFLETKPKNDNVIMKFFSLWRLATGPSKQELLLSKQRQELIERAERAEAMAFEAIAETSDVGRQRDSLLEKVKELEDKINTLNHSNKSIS